MLSNQELSMPWNTTAAAHPTVDNIRRQLSIIISRCGRLANMPRIHLLLQKQLLWIKATGIKWRVCHPLECSVFRQTGKSRQIDKNNCENHIGNTYLQVDVAGPTEKNPSFFKMFGKLSKYRDLEIEISRTWYHKTTILAFLLRGSSNYMKRNKHIYGSVQTSTM